MIEFRPSFMDGPPSDVFRTDRRMTVDAWFTANSATYAIREPGSESNVVLLINGKHVPAREWGDATFGPDDHVLVYPVAFGGGGGFFGSVFKVLDTVFLGALSGLMGLLTPSAPSNNASSQRQGDRLNEATLKTNTAKINSPVRESFGRNRIYPDIIMPPRRYFTAPREQKIDLLFLFGGGEYELGPEDFLIGDTRALALGADFRSRVFKPGESLSADVRHEWWHQAPEVGASSKGSAGLELRATFDVDPDLTDVSELTFTEDVIFIPSGAGEFPEGWTGGAIVRVEQYLDYTVESGTWIRGPLAQLAPFVGMRLEIVGPNEGTYRVGTYTPYSPPVPAEPGSASTATGSAAPSRFDFGVTPVSFNVVFDNGIFPVTLDEDVSNLSGLLSAINADLPAKLEAVESGGRVRIEEQSPFTGAGITVSAGASDVFGPSVVYETGTATTAAQPEVQARMSLTFEDGSPVTGLVNGLQRMAIGYEGLLYRIVAGSEFSIAVERLTDTGAIDGTWPGFEFNTAVDAVLTLDGSSVEGDWTGPFAACPEGEVVDIIEWDVFFPGGLIYINDKGRTQRIRVNVDMEWREIGSTSGWNRVTKSYVDGTPDQIGFTEQEVLPRPLRPEIRARRVGAPSKSTSAQDTVLWYGLKSRIPRAPTAYPNVTVAAVTVTGGDRLAAQVENQISAWATRKLPLLDGTFGTTRDIAPAFLQVCRSVGYSESDINMAELARLHAVWSARGDYYDDSVGDASTVKQVLNDMLGAGFAELTVQRGVITPVRDEPRSTFDGHPFSRQNFLKGTSLGKSTQTYTPDDFDGVDVEYLDADSWQWLLVKCRLPGDAGIRPKKVRVQGIKSREKAWQWGMRARSIMKYRRTVYNWSTPTDLLNVGYMGHVSLVDDVPGYTQSGIVDNVTYAGGRAFIEPRETFDWDGLDDPVVGLRRPNGTLSGPYQAERLDDNVLVINLPDFEMIPYSSATPTEPTHLYLGTAERWAYRALIQQVTPQGLRTASATAVNYDDRVYLYDNSPLPEDA